MKNELSVIDLFSGCGGLSLGFEQESFIPLLFSEINRDAAATYKLNRHDLDIVEVGDIYKLTNEDLSKLKKEWRKKGFDDIDVVAGGPPCQGYSGIGHRRTFKLDKEEIPSNHLFQEMVRVIKCIKPKVFLFENVKGLLSGRWTKNGEKGEIFRDVLSAFKKIRNYECEWQLVHAKDYGVPQNRPRTLIIGYRKDILKSCKSLNSIKGLDADPGLGNGRAVEIGFLPKKSDKKPPTIPQLLGDLEDPDFEYGGSTENYPREPIHWSQEVLRTNLDGSKIRCSSRVTEHDYSNHSKKIIEKFSYMIKNDGKIPSSMQTKKFAQRVFPTEWNGSGPNITATSLPDDYVHYSQARIPTVREWARIQTFPDWYQFAGPRTTGGRRRAGDPNAGIWERDVPKYTQIGNAVPVFLARSIAAHIKSILQECS